MNFIRTGKRSREPLFQPTVAAPAFSINSPKYMPLYGPSAITDCPSGCADNSQLSAIIS